MLVDLKKKKFILIILLKSVLFFQIESSNNEFYMLETFDKDKTIIGNKWIPSNNSKYLGQWKIDADVQNSLLEDSRLALSSRAQYHAISANLSKKYVFGQKSLVIQ